MKVATAMCIKSGTLFARRAEELMAQHFEQYYSSGKTDWDLLLRIGCAVERVAECVRRAEELERTIKDGYSELYEHPLIDVMHNKGCLVHYDLYCILWKNRDLTFVEEFENKVAHALCVEDLGL